MDIRKALDLASSAAAYLIPEVVDGAIRDFAAKVPTMYNAVQKRPWASQTYFIRKRLSLPTASWSIDGGPLPAATQSTYGRTSASMRYLYTRGEVTGPMIAAAGSTFDALGSEIEAHQQAMVERLSTDIVTANGGSQDIKGILYQITDDSSLYTAAGGAGQIVDAGGGYLSLNWIDKAIDASTLTSGMGVAGPGATVAVTTRPVLRMINSLLQAQQRFMDSTEISAGFRVSTYDGIPFVVDNHWQDNAKILFFDANRATLLVHKDFTYEELAKTKDSVDFFIKGYFGFALEGAASLLRNFALTPNI
jgi:HK97 family phage major capsid protein